MAPTTRFEFEYVTHSGMHDTVAFFAESESEARTIAENWIGDNGTIGDCIGRWSIGD
jgi:hypothetical protein